MAVLDWSPLLQLPPVNTDPKAVGSVAPSRVHQGAEPCGRSFQQRQFVSTATAKAGSSEKDSEEDFAFREKLRVKLDRKDLDLDDYYALMGLEELGWKSTVDQIKAQWKHISFICHPDKSSPEDREYGEKRFKAMQLAYTTFTDKQKRIGYDSALPFDEKIPKENDGNTAATFYKVYGPVFARNARFSVVQPVPDLGDKKASDDEVNAFYDFWLGLKSWRDFTHLDEHKNDDGTDRFTRRENDRKNAKLRAGAKQKEVARVRRLVEEGMTKDPRMVKMKEAAILEATARKDAIKNKKKAAKQAEVDKIEAEAKAIADVKAADQATKDAKRKAGSSRTKVVKKMKRLFNAKRAGEFEEKHVERVLANATVDQLQSLIDLISLHMAGPESPPLSAAETEAARSEFRAVLRTLQSDEENAASDAAANALAEKEAVVKEAARKIQEEKDLRLWTAEEEDVLEKAIVKYLKNRDWPLMTDLVNRISPYTRDKKEIIHKVKEIEARAPPASDAPTSSAAATGDAATGDAAEAPKAVAASAAPVVQVVDNSGDWTPEQQQALMAAMKKFGKETPKRFEKIAPLVPGKNKMQCVQRFKFLRAQAEANGGRHWVWGHDWDAIACYPGAILNEEEKASLALGPPIIAEWF